MDAPGITESLQADLQVGKKRDNSIHMRGINTETSLYTETILLSMR